HNFWKHVEVVEDDEAPAAAAPAVPAELSAIRAAAGRRGGQRSVEARKAKFGSAQPPNSGASGEQTNEASAEANAKQAPPSASLSPPPPLPSPPPSDPNLKPVVSKTCQVFERARGQRPQLKIDHFLAQKITAREWRFSDAFSAYASE